MIGEVLDTLRRAREGVRHVEPLNTSQNRPASDCRAVRSLLTGTEHEMTGENKALNMYPGRRSIDSSRIAWTSTSMLN